MSIENYTIEQKRVPMQIEKSMFGANVRQAFKKLEQLGSAAAYAIHR